MLPPVLLVGDDDSVRDEVSNVSWAVRPYLIHPFGDMDLHGGWEWALVLQGLTEVLNEHASDGVVHRVLSTV
eukprot:3284506-Rhodomonas_salina.1